MRFVIDTSVFVNPDVYVQFGKSIDEAIDAFVGLAKESNHEFYMPPSVFKELSHFSKKTDDLELVVKKRSPNVYSLYVPAAVLYDIVSEVRKRIDKGLRIAEKYAVAEGTPEEVRKLRERYREAVRHGIVDSTEDLDVVLLAKELDAVIVSADEGIINLANKLSCEWIDARKFKKMINQ